MSTPWLARHGMTPAEYQAAFDDAVRRGFRLREVSGYRAGNSARYAAIWDKSAGPAWVARHGLSSTQYQSEFEKLAHQGYRLKEVSGYGAGAGPLYAGVWEKSAGPAWVARHGMSAVQYQAEFDRLVRQGYRLTDVSGYPVGNGIAYAAIWEKTKGPAWTARHGLTSAQYQAEFDKLVKQGYRLRKVSGYAVGAQARYAAIWEKAGGPGWVARHGMTGAEYQGEFTNLRDQGYRLTWVNGYSVAGTTRYAAIWESEGMRDADLALIDSRINGYMSRYAIPGLSIAITKGERLVFAKGFGYADSSVRERMNPSHTLRIASISKPVTAVAVSELVENGKLSVENRVFGTGAILGKKFGTKAYSEAVKAIRVRHLLQHTSGFTNDGGDPMFFDGSMSQAALIGWMLDNRPLKAPPGDAYEYSNFGFCVLGRVIEQVTGKPYETYVKSVLAQCGITSMRIGGSSLGDRRPGEVVYAGSGAYNLLPARMDAHGGWIASPIDLVRFMARTDGFAAKTDILKPVSEAAMFAGSKANSGYGFGWIVDSTYRGHNGAMPGTIGFLVRRNDGFSFAALANTRPAADKFCFELKGVLDGIVTAVGKWPAYDLF
jgi:CubicO group peptidase (beta-lactamase class C family)